jgi:hypothetical protein
MTLSAHTLPPVTDASKQSLPIESSESSGSTVLHLGEIVREYEAVLSSGCLRAGLEFAGEDAQGAEEWRSPAKGADPPRRIAGGTG